MPPLRIAKSTSSLDRAKPATKLRQNTTRTDVILPMNQPYMGQIISGLKTYEFRKYRLSHSVKRVWFYVTAPESRISHICDIGVAKTRNPGDVPLPTTGLGNQEYNDRHPDWDGYDYAYEIETCLRVSSSSSSQGHEREIWMQRSAERAGLCLSWAGRGLSFRRTDQDSPEHRLQRSLILTQHPPVLSILEILTILTKMSE